MADTKTADNPEITLGNLSDDVAALHAKLDTLFTGLSTISGQLSILDSRFAAVETMVAEVRPLLSHPWVARLLKKTGHVAPVQAT